jgi:tRNA threonylcarbamoyladenosine biosynthesis protein TsaB
MLLALDTSTNYACLALADGDTLLAELNWRVGQRHGSEALERARWLLRSQNIAMGQLDGIAVALGPGSFNGVRVAVATAKTLAFALDIPLYGVPTLDSIAWGARLSADPVWALLDAGRGEVFAACYDTSADDRFTDGSDDSAAAAAWAPRRVAGAAASPYLIITPEALAARISGPVVFTGEWRATTHDVLALALGAQARFTSSVGARRGAWLAELATWRARRGVADDPRALEPLYLRRPNITSSARTPTTPAASQPGGEEAAHAL